MEITLIVLVALLAAAGLGLVVLFRARDSAVKAQHEAERELAVARQKLSEAENRHGDFEALRRESLQAAQAAMLQTAQALSSKLLDDHKRETTAAKEETALHTQKVSEAFIKRVEQLTNVVASIESRQSKSDRTIETVWRSLSNPSGAGQLAETILGNTLKSFAFETPRDYVLQFSTSDSETGRRLRPDAVVFLPGNSVVVVDVKASKFLLDIAAAEGTAKEEEAYRGLASTMNTHLKGLSSKDYQSAVLTTFRDSGRGSEIAHIYSLMFLPSEAALEKIHRADPEFMGRARALNIIPAGPGGLHSVLSFASTEIGLMRQAENYRQIIEDTRALIDNLGVVLGYAMSAGKGLKSAADGFANFTNSVNKRLFSKIRKLGKLGIQGSKPLPGNLPEFTVTIHEGETIEGEAEEVETPPAAPPRPRLIGE